MTCNEAGATPRSTEALDGADHGSVHWIRVADVVQLRQVACQRILNAAARAIAQRHQFLIVLAGGLTPRDIYRMLRNDTDWSRWHIYFSDERCLPSGDTGRNSAMAAGAWLDHVPIPPDQVHTIPAELGATAAALAYCKTLHGVGAFDLVLLGLGEDGHTASLFTGSDWGVAADSADALPVFDAPKAPSQRVSLSASRLSRTRELLFLVAGESKRDAVARWRAGADVPASAIHPEAGVDVLVESMLVDASLS